MIVPEALWYPPRHLVIPPFAYRKQSSCTMAMAQKCEEGNVEGTLEAKEREDSRSARVSKNTYVGDGGVHGGDGKMRGTAWSLPCAAWAYCTVMAGLCHTVEVLWTVPWFLRKTGYGRLGLPRAGILR
jgi:hypothetical protein